MGNDNVTNLFDNRVEETLLEAASSKYDDVIVLGMKDGILYYHTSSMDEIQFLGMLTAASRTDFTEGE